MVEMAIFDDGLVITDWSVGDIEPCTPIEELHDRGLSVKRCFSSDESSPATDDIVDTGLIDPIYS